MIPKPTETIYGRLLNINVKDDYIIREWKSHISIRAPVLSMYVSRTLTSASRGDDRKLRKKRRCYFNPSVPPARFQMIDNSSQVVLYLCVT